MRVEFEELVNDENLCGEGPLWDWRHRRFVWNDLSASLVFDYCPQSRQRRTISRGLMVSGIALCGQEGFVFAGSTGLHLWHGQDDCRTLLSTHDGQNLCFNDIVVDSQGRIYAGTYYWDQTGMLRPGKLYLIDNGGSAHVIDEDVYLSNGLGLSPDQRTLYFADSGKCRIWAYDVDTASGHLSGKRVFVNIPAEEGLPDGLTVDDEGFVWCALWYGGQIVRYDAEGHIERRLHVPVKQVTSVAFGGADLDELFVTTAAEPWPNNLVPNYDPALRELGGALYRTKLEIRGRPEFTAHLPLDDR